MSAADVPAAILAFFATVLAACACIEWAAVRDHAKALGVSLRDSAPGAAIYFTVASALVYVAAAWLVWEAR